MEDPSADGSCQQKIIQYLNFTMALGLFFCYYLQRERHLSYRWSLSVSFWVGWIPLGKEVMSMTKEDLFFVFFMLWFLSDGFNPSFLKTAVASAYAYLRINFGK